MAGGPSTPELAAAVADAGGLGFVAAGYLTPDALAEHLARTRALTERAFGVNVFAPTGQPADPSVVSAYAERLRAEADRAGIALGQPRFDDDAFDPKVALLRAEPPAVVSFTFGCPPASVIASLRDAGCAVWVTVTGVDEAREAVSAGADALVVQGVEAGGHRGAFVDREDRVDYGLLALLQLVGAAVDVPLVAAGGIATGRGVAAVLTAGAAAAQVGTAFMLCPEAGTSEPHRTALASERPTGLTRAFSGRLARGVVNRLQAEQTADAPLAYPEVHHVTSPLRAHARKAGDESVINLWAGEAHSLAEELPAAEVVARRAADARAALLAAQERGPCATPRLERLEQVTRPPHRDADGIGATLGAVASRNDEDVVSGRDHVARRAPRVGLQLRLARDVPVDVRRPEPVLRAPGDERVQRRPQVLSRRGQLVHRAGGPVGVVAFLHDAVVDQGSQPLGEHRPRDVQPRDPLAVAADPEERVPDDQQRPPLPEHLERRRQGTLLTRVVLAEHSRRV